MGVEQYVDIFVDVGCVYLQRMVALSGFVNCDSYFSLVFVVV